VDARPRPRAQSRVEGHVGRRHRADVGRDLGVPELADVEVAHLEALETERLSQPTPGLLRRARPHGPRMGVAAHPARDPSQPGLRSAGPVRPARSRARHQGGTIQGPPQAGRAVRGRRRASGRHARRARRTGAQERRPPPRRGRPATLRPRAQRRRRGGAATHAEDPPRPALRGSGSATKR